jgi:hypothetical protein
MYRHLQHQIGFNNFIIKYVLIVYLISIGEINMTCALTLL